MNSFNVSLKAKLVNIILFTLCIIAVSSNLHKTN